MNKLPEKIKLDIQGETIEFSLTDKREIKYYGKSKTSNESLWRTDKLDDNEVFYQTEWGWGVFVTVEERELSFEERCEIQIARLEGMYSSGKEVFIQHSVNDVKQITMDKNNIPTKLITITYNNKTIESYEN
jgi:hypothetical protein